MSNGEGPHVSEALDFGDLIPSPPGYLGSHELPISVRSRAEPVRDVDAALTQVAVHLA